MDQYRPRNFMLLPTMSCQGSCVYCFGPNKGPVMDDQTSEKAASFISKIVPQDGPVHITFHGGEPLSAPVSWYRHILPLLRDRFGRRLKLSMQSNLLALSEEMLSVIEEYEIAIGTSVDGYASMCDAQRGEGYYEKNSLSQKKLSDRGLSAGSVCTFTPPYVSRGSIEKVFHSFRTPFSLHGSVPCLGCPPTAHNLSVGQMKTLLLEGYSVYRENISNNRITTIDSMARGCLEEKGCTCTFFDCVGVFAAIAADGGVYSCQRFCGHEEYCFGSVKDSLTEEKILKSPAWQRLRRQQDITKDACGECRHYAYCMGGCLYNALTAKADKDPYCEAYSAAFDRISLDMTLEMGQVLLGEESTTPVLAMAGSRPHPYDQARSRERLKAAVISGKTAVRSGMSGGLSVVRQSVVHPENHLNKLYLHLTYDCPLHCPHCYAEGGDRKCTELSGRQFSKIIRQAVSSRFRSVVLTGGEPLVYTEFGVLLQELGAIDKKGTKLILRSSFGFLIPADRLKQICDVFDEIIISVDGDEKSHDARRGRGRYALTVQNLERAAGLGFAHKLGLCATLDHSLCRGVQGSAVAALADQLHITKVRFRPVLPLGRAADKKPESMRLCAEEELLFDDFRPRFSCGLGQNLYVEPNGDVYPCYAWCEKDKLLGNLGESSLPELLSTGDLYEYCRHDVDTNEKCRTCEVRYLCGGICKAFARDKHNVDSGDFDCTERKACFQRIADLNKEI